MSTTTTQFGPNKTPFSISDILTDLKVNGGDQSPREDCKSEESDSVIQRFNHHKETMASGVKQMIYGITGGSARDSEGLQGYTDVANAMRRRVEEKRASGSFVRRGSLECFLIDNKNQSQAQGYLADRRDSYFGDQGAAQKPLDMRRSVGSISDHYDSGGHS